MKYSKEWFSRHAKTRIYDPRYLDGTQTGTGTDYQAVDPTTGATNVFPQSGGTVTGGYDDTGQYVGAGGNYDASGNFVGTDPPSSGAAPGSSTSNPFGTLFSGLQSMFGNATGNNPPATPASYNGVQNASATGNPATPAASASGVGSWISSNPGLVIGGGAVLAIMVAVASRKS
jgi:hypothetical protein